MPYSSSEGKDWIAARVAGLSPAPARVLDVGPGAGAYARLLRPLLPDARIEAAEIHAPYAERFGLARLYDRVWVADARTWGWPGRPWDLVVLGDVLEHMEEADARAVWDSARAAGRWLVASLPTSERFWEQGAWGGVEHERHLHRWTFEEFRAMPGVEDAHRGADVSAFLARGAI